ncbi:hypothetical protein [Sphingobacterium gobiense]|uniref:Uncharacterized protein n=1 Tax=Sphingobacterium gobiense TaxID=1382456 RepID=A0A2S9JL17_9SPHI|nr:hypothetical protein [Sphingobacterium gobiense]PRD53806.1 hypothetical protein C5749_09805 [Sphingobacterium gobiense]
MKNSFVLGMAFGVVFPLLAYLAATFTAIQTSLFIHKPIALYVIAATANLIGVRFLYRYEKDATANGVVLVTFLAMIVLIVVKRELVFSYA